MKIFTLACEQQVAFLSSPIINHPFIKENCSMSVVQFIALIYVSALRKEMRKSKLIEQYTVRELLQEMDTLTKIKYSGKYGHILTEITKSQREILEGLNIALPC